MTMSPTTVAHDRIKQEVVMYSDNSFKAVKITSTIWASAWASYAASSKILYWPALGDLMTSLEAAH